MLGSERVFHVINITELICNLFGHRQFIIRYPLFSSQAVVAPIGLANFWWVLSYICGNVMTRTSLLT